MNERYQQTRNDGRTVPYDEWQRRMGPVDQSRDNEWQRGPYYGDQQARQDAWGRESMRGEIMRSPQDGTEWMGTQGRSFDQPQGEWIPQQGRPYSRQGGFTQQMRPFDQPTEMPPQTWFGAQGTWAPPGAVYPQRGSNQPERWTTENERWSTVPSGRQLSEQSIQYVPTQFGPMLYVPQFGPMQPVPAPFGSMMPGSVMMPIGPAPHGPTQLGLQPYPMTEMRQQTQWRDQDLARHSHRGRGPRNYQRSDERIREDICDILLQDHLIDASEIEVEVTRGEVTLTGKVADRWEKFRAEDISANIPGVRDVTNQVKVEERMGRAEADEATTNTGRTTSKGSRSSTAG